jgi:hypothetical protein
MFKPKQTHPKWYLWLYPYLLALRYNPKYFFLVIAGRKQIFGWHYEWEYLEDQQEDLYVSEALEKAKKKWSNSEIDKDNTN